MSKTLFAALIALVPPLFGETLVGRVVRVSDGDTITVLDSSSRQEKVRLAKIDAPEKNQAYGQRSKQRLSELVFGKDVSVEWSDREKWDRILGDVCVCSTNVNLQMVKEGLAWHYSGFDSSEEFKKAEQEARQKRLGLWRDASPVEPWNFRKAK